MAGRKKETYSVPGQQDFSLYGNQSAVLTNKTDYGKEGVPFMSVGISEWMEAKRNLKDASFTLYLYLCSNKDGYISALSPSDFCAKTGVSRKSFYNARDELLEKGYMTLCKANGKTLLYDIYMFYTSPDKNPEFNE